MVGSGVTGAEFACAYLALGVPVTLVSSPHRVLPGEDADAAACSRRCSPGAAWTVSPSSRMESVARVDDIVNGDAHRRPDGRGLALHPGSRLGAEHRGLGLDEAGVATDEAAS